MIARMTWGRYWGCSTPEESAIVQKIADRILSQPLILILPRVPVPGKLNAPPGDQTYAQQILSLQRGEPKDYSK
jgi:hypothetical protein